ncbi:MAG TPA: PAS domain S-box protein, partial [Kamptonema sp.]|nr:PAS domain S-box protein [Kamptonema sp.]
IDISLTVSPIKDATGKIVGASKIARDISDRKRAEAALIESEAQSRALITAIPDLIMRIDRAGVYLEFVTTYSSFHVLGDLSNMVGSHVSASLPPELAQKRIDFIQRALEMNSIQIYEQELLIDGKRQIEEVRIVPYSKDEVLALVRDISDRKLAEDALIQSEAQSRAILAAIPDFMFRTDANGIYQGGVTANREIDFFPAEFDSAGSAMVDVLPPEIATRHLHYLHQALSTGELQVYEQQIQVGDRLQDEEVRVVKSGEDEALFMIRDISDRKLAERQLHQLNQELEAKVEERTQELWQVNSLQRAILDGADYSIISTDPNGIIQTFNAGAERMLGYSAAEMVGKATPAIIHDLNEVIDRAASLSVELGQDIAPGFEVFVAKARQGTIVEQEWSYIRKDGSCFPVSLSISALKDVNQQIIGFLGIAKDITERKQAEAELQKLSDRLALSLKSGAIGCWEWDLAQNTLLGDERMYELFSITQASHVPVAYDLWANKLHPEDRTFTETLLHQAVLGQAEYNTEYRIVEPDGSIKFMAASGVVVQDAQGNPQSMIGINFDISDRKRAEAELQKLSERLALALKSGAIGCWEWDLVQNSILWDERMYELYGVTKQSDSRVVYDIWASGLHPDDRTSIETLLQQAILGQAEYDTEFRVVHPDGSIHFIKASGVVVRDDHGNPQGMTGINFDISDRKQAEIERQQLIQELSAFKLALDQSAIVVITDTQGAITYVNDRFCEISGYSRDELLGHTHGLVNSGYHSPTFFQELWDTISSGQIWRGEVCNRTKNDSLYWVASTIVPFLDEQGQPFQYLAIRFDITARKLAEAAIQQENTFRQQIVENMAEGLCVFHEIEEFPFLCFTVWNQKMQAITGYTLEEINRLGWYQSFYPDPLGQEQALLRMEQMRKGISFIAQEREIQRKDGQKSIIALSTSFLPSNNSHKYVLVLIQDITDRKKTEQAMTQQLAAIEAAIDGIGIIQGDNYIYVNQAHVELFGYQHPEELIGKSWKSFYPPEELERLEQEVFPMLERDLAWQGEAIAIRKDGSTFTEGVSKTITKNGLLICVCRDISDRKQTEKALQESQQFLQTVLDTIPLPLFWKNRECVFLGCNYQLANSLHLSSTVEIVGKTDFELSTTETQALAYRASDRQVMESGEGKLGIEETLILPSGEQKWIETHKAPLRDWENNVIGVVGMFQDITERKQAELKLQQQAEQERLLSTITQRMRSSLNLDDILNVTVEELHKVLRVHRMLIYRVFPGGTGAAIAEAVSPNWPKILDIVFPEEVFPEANYARYIEGRVYALSDREDPNQSVLPCLVEFLADIQVRAKLVVPIIQNQTLWGLLIAHQCDRPRQWQDWEINLLKQTANQLAIGIQQSNLFKQLQTELAERQRAEAQLTETNAQLAISNEELIRATRLKDEFLANMSHELRTPLNAILGMAEGLQEEVFGIINEPQIKALQTIERSGSHLLELINDILDIAKIESGQMELECTNVSINHLCQSSLVFIKQIALKKRMQLELKVPLKLPDLLIDERRIRQVLINLLNNAVKFTPNGGRITLEVSYQQREIVLTSPLEGISKVSVYQTALERGLGIKTPPEGIEVRNYLRIAIIDTGIGIAPEHIDKLFQPFIQIDSALNRQYAGTGLGLALVKRIVELHGGVVGLTSEVGVGSCFTIDLPCTPVEPSSATRSIPCQTPEPESESLPPIAASQPEPQPSPLILLAEDNEANIITISSYLGAKNYRILLAKNGQEAIDFAITHQPNLILMDIQMPGMDGLEAMRQMRRDPNLVEIPIVALTALAMSGDREKCLAAGANDYMTKPIKLKQLATMIQELLEPGKL